MTSHASILIVEDEPDLAELIADYLRASDYRPTIFGDGQEALNAVKQTMPDLIVLDLMLPGLDGLSFCREVRRFSKVPIVIVTAKVEEVDRLLGLEIGADDYLCKPFSPRELVARIKAILRRVEPMRGIEMSTPATNIFTIDETTQRIFLRECALELTRSEYLILRCFLLHIGQVFSRAQLLDMANQDSLDVTDRAIDSHIKNLRKKIKQQLPDSDPIHSIYGLGYRFDGI